MATFAELGLSKKTLTALEHKGFEEPTEIQALTIPLLLADELDIIAQAQTGTGKTAAFGLPLLEKLDPTVRKVQAIILAPTRELVIQICEEISSLKGSSALTIAPLYGGQSIWLQLNNLDRGVSIVVGTPGRIIDHLERKSLKLDTITHFILDEADEMLNMGFIDDIETILKSTPAKKRVLLFSATMPPRIKLLAEKYMGKYTHLRAHSALSANLTDQIYFEVAYQDKFEALSRIIDIEPDFYGIVFCRTKIEVDELTAHLLDRGYPVDALHGDITQMQREKILGKFRKKQLAILAATDVAARGIDVNNLTHVINYSLPQNPESYIHRIGRTGRAGNQGTAITFVTPAEFYKLGFIRQITKADIRRKPIPEVGQIIDTRKKKIATDIAHILQTGLSQTYIDWARDIVAAEPPESVIAAVLKLAFHKTLDESMYKKLTPIHGKKPFPVKSQSAVKTGPSYSPAAKTDNSATPPFIKTPYGTPLTRGRTDVEEEGKTRLFIARGIKDNITRKSLIDFIVKKAGTMEHLIGNIEIHETFSFVTVPFAEAVQILYKFKTLGDGRSIVTMAKPKAPDRPVFRPKRKVNQQD